MKNGVDEGKEHGSARLVAKEVADLWRAQTPSGTNISSAFTQEEFAAAPQHLKPGEAPGPDSICPEHTPCCSSLEVLAKSFPLFLFAPSHDPHTEFMVNVNFKNIYKSRCLCLKHLRLQYHDLDDGEFSQMTREITLLTQDIEDSYSAKRKAGDVFVDLTAAYDNVWHRGLTCKLLCLIPDKYVDGVIVELVRNCSFALTTGRGSKAGYDASRMGSPSAYDLTLVFSTGDWQSLEGTLSLPP